jgi:hypothetical protein
MDVYNFEASNVITKVWLMLSGLFLFAVIMFGVRDTVISSILPTGAAALRGGFKSKLSR